VAGRSGPRAAAPLALTLALAACLGGCSAAGTPSPSVAPATATPAPTAAASIPLDLCANTGADCVPPAGRYLAQQFQPPIGFTLDDGWANGTYVERAIQLVRPGIDTATQSLSIVSGQLDGPTGAAAAAGTTAAQFLTYVRALPGLTVSGQAAVLIGGLAATQLDVKVDKKANVTLFNLPISASQEDPFYLRAGETARLVVVDAAGQRVVFVIEVFGTASMADFLKTEMQPFLTSVTFQPTP